MKRFLVSFLTLCLFVLQSAESVCANQTLDNQPQVIKAVPAVYPVVALNARASGVVTVQVEIDANGAVVSAKAIGGHRFLQAVSELAAKRWLFAPKSEVRKANLLFRFIIMPEGASYQETLPVFLPPYEVEIRDTPGGISFTTIVDPPSSIRSSNKRRRRINK